MPEQARTDAAQPYPATYLLRRNRAIENATMAINNATLSDFTPSESDNSASDTQEAPDTNDRTDNQPPTSQFRDYNSDAETAQSNTCGICGSHVSSDWQRVFADNDGRVHACLNCAAKNKIRVGAASKADVENRNAMGDD